MPVGRWFFEKDAENKAFIIYRNGSIFAIASYTNLDNDETEDEVWKGVREMADAIELGRPYLEAMNPSMFDE